ncbi:MAG: hypothetical protein IT385_05605 [Deltaproteobacteria bacterium]|nr:hypothetical protein [Deltaproteobacteria bacterium]
MRRAWIPCLALVVACGDDTSSPADTAATTDTIVTTDAGDTTSATDASLETVAEVSTDATTDAADATPAEPTPVCVAVRGNGELITAHFAALAQIAEHFGPFEGVAGGSSASISAFLTESMHMHPGLATCGGAACTRREAADRLGLLYKSLFGYLEAMGDSDEAVAVAQILRVIEIAQEKGIGSLVDQDLLSEAWSALVSLLTSDEVAALVNAEVLEFLSAPDSLTAHVKDVWEAFTTFGNFRADSPKIFLRPGLVDFAGLASKIGRIGSFYAGYGTYDAAAWEAFFAACAAPGRGMPWPAVAELASEGKTCRERLRAILDPWRAAFIPTEGDPSSDNRIDDRVGQHLRTLVVTSVLTGQAAADFHVAKQAYFADEAWTLAVDFDDVRIGYWGAAADTAAVVGNARGYTDAKTAKAMTLGQATWHQALSLSPAEPGLSRAIPIDQQSVSAGGWPDLAPVLALRNAGCERVIYLTRRGGESVFAQQIAGLLGMDAATQTALYDLGNADSAFNQSLEEAAGVWCTNWNVFGATDLAGIVGDAMSAPLEVHDATLVPLMPYTGQTTRANLPGCTPGVVPPPP